jgi:hypothetical protein
MVHSSTHTNRGAAMAAARLESRVAVEHSPSQEDNLSPEIITKIQQAIKEAAKALGSHIVALIGNTGAGKSTAVNGLLDRVLIRDIRNGSIKVKNEQDEVAKIGHRPGVSCTLFTNVYSEHPITGTAQPLVFADCGGFLNTQGADEIPIVASLKLTLENAASVRLVLCYNANALLVDRGVHFNEFVRTTLRKLITDYQDARCKDSIMFMFTQPRMFVNDRISPPVRYTIGNLLEELADLRDGSDPTSELRMLLDFVLRDKGIYVSLYDPVCEGEQDNGSRDDVLKTLIKMKEIEKPKGFFRTAYSLNAWVKLSNLMTTIAYEGKALYDRCTYNGENSERLSQEIERIGEKMRSIEKKLTDIGDGNGDPAIIQEAIQESIRQQEQNIREQEEDIKKLAVKNGLIKEAHDTADDKLTALQKEGEKEEVQCWHEFIKKPKVVDIKTQQVKVLKYPDAKPWTNNFLKTTLRTINVATPQPITKDFIYKGEVPIKRVVLSPSNEDSCWSDKKPEDTIDATSYSIKYTTERGKDADASVTIFIRKKHSLQFSVEESQLRKEINVHKDHLLELTDQENSYNRTIIAAQKVIAAKGGVLAKVAEYKENYESLEREFRSRNDDLTKINSEAKEIQDKIQASESNFAFLRDYIRLSEDAFLENTPIIKEFLNKDSAFIRK